MMLHCAVKWDACFGIYPSQGGRLGTWIFQLFLPSVISLHLPFMACSLNCDHLSFNTVSRHYFQDAASTAAAAAATAAATAAAASPCYLTLLSSVALGGLPVVLTKSLMTTLSSPSLRTQRCTTRRTFCNLRSSANRWGSVRMGCSGSFSKDSLITSLSLYSGWASRWRRSSVELFILN